MSVLDQVRSVASSAGGAVLGTATRAVAAVRPTEKPLHPRGEVVIGRLVRHGGGGSGVPWLDEPGEEEVLVRRSRAVGLPSSLPDIHGVAIRVPVGDGVEGADGAGAGHGDVLLASTGYGPLTRWVLTASRDPGGRPLTCLLPYRSPRGPLLIGALALGEDDFELSWSLRTGGWQDFATLHLTPTAADPVISFDPVKNRIPGLEQYGWVQRLREPAYAWARLSR